MYKIKTFSEPFKSKTSSKTRQEPYKIVAKTNQILSPKLLKRFFRIVLKKFREFDDGIVGIQNIRSYFLFRIITKILGSDVFIKIFSKKGDPPPEGGVNTSNVTLIASDAIWYCKAFLLSIELAKTVTEKYELIFWQIYFVKTLAEDNFEYFMF